jgi:carbon-monoxide dehydrogenase large subunit
MVCAARISHSVRRREDARFITGSGTYTDDVNAEGQAYAYFVRSEHAHGIVRSVGTVEARRMPGVLGVYTGHDLNAAGIGGLPFLPIPGFATDDPVETPRPALALERVRYVGEQVALVVAETRSQAIDAAEQVRVDIEPLPAVTTIEAAIAQGAPRLWPEAPANVVLTWECGDRAQIDAAFARAAHVTKLKLVNNRVVANAMEPRAILAAYDAAEDRFRLTVPTQGVIYYRRALNEATFRLAPEQVHVRTHDVGGAFGNKEFPYPEDIAVMHAARAIGRPVKCYHRLRACAR